MPMLEIGYFAGPVAKVLTPSGLEERPLGIMIRVLSQEIASSREPVIQQTCILQQVFVKYNVYFQNYKINLLAGTFAYDDDVQIDEIVHDTPPQRVSQERRWSHAFAISFLLYQVNLVNSTAPHDFFFHCANNCCWSDFSARESYTSCLANQNMFL